MKVLRILGIIILIPIVLILVLLIILSLISAVPKDYTETTQTGGKIEAKYLKKGEDKVKKTKAAGSELPKNYYIYYPEKLSNSAEKFPAVVILNGTGILPQKYPALFEHLASWGFIVIGNDNPSSGFGKLADEVIDYLITENQNPDSQFYEKFDLEDLGITGHSQGEAGVFTAISIMKYRDKYKATVALSPTHEETAHAFGWNYELEKITIPTIILAGTSGDFETQAVIPLEKMVAMYEKIPSQKIMARRKNAEHSQMLYQADGYVTAWFRWWLMNDIEAQKAFTGKTRKS